MQLSPPDLWAPSLSSHQLPLISSAHTLKTHASLCLKTFVHASSHLFSVAMIHTMMNANLRGVSFYSTWYIYMQREDKAGT